MKMLYLAVRNFVVRIYIILLIGRPLFRRISEKRGNEA